MERIIFLWTPIIKEKDAATKNAIMIPTGRYLVKDSDVLVLLGPDKALAGLKE